MRSLCLKISTVLYFRVFFYPILVRFLYHNNLHSFLVISQMFVLHYALMKGQTGVHAYHRIHWERIH